MTREVSPLSKPTAHTVTQSQGCNTEWQLMVVPVFVCAERQSCPQGRVLDMTMSLVRLSTPVAVSLVITTRSKCYKLTALDCLRDRQVERAQESTDRQTDRKRQTDTQ